MQYSAEYTNSKKEVIRLDLGECTGVKNACDIARSRTPADYTLTNVFATDLWYGIPQ